MISHRQEVEKCVALIAGVAVGICAALVDPSHSAVGFTGRLLMPEVGGNPLHYALGLAATLLLMGLGQSRGRWS